MMTDDITMPNCDSLVGVASTLDQAYQEAMLRQWAVQMAASIAGANSGYTGGASTEQIVKDAETLLAFVEGNSNG